MTGTAVPAELIRLHVTRRPTIDTEGPYLDELGDVTDGSLALARPLPLPRTSPAQPAVESELPPLRLVPDADEPATDDDDLCFDPVRTPRVDLPAPGPHAATLTRMVLEVLAGDRPLRQLTRCATPEVCDEVEVLVSPRAPRPWAGSLRRLMVCEPVAGVAEVSAIVSQGVRTVALALRLEGVDGRWQLTALQLG